jgi:hypothetical protein
VCRALGEIIRQSPELNWLALVDGAFDYGSAGLRLPNKRHALYGYDGMSDLLAASPFLITLTADDDNRLQSELTALVRHRKERPMLSFIGTTSTASGVNENFRLFANALTDDEQEFLLRFADTRVLPGLAGALRHEHWGGMTCLLSEWIVIDRKGELRELSLQTGRVPLPGKFRLSSAEFASFLSSSEPDAIIDAIADSNPAALPEANRAAVYEQVAASCAFAKRHKVHAFPDLVALAYLGVLNNGACLKDSRLSEMLGRQQWKSGSLINELSDFVE